MVDEVRARPKPAEDERCAFCHDAILGDPLDAGLLRAECSKCRAPHHAGCFVENAGCAVMGCGGDATTRVGALKGKWYVATLAREIGGSVDRPIPERVKRTMLVRGERAALIVAGLAAVILLIGLANQVTYRVPRAAAIALWIVLALTIALVWLRATVRHFAHPAAPVLPDERTGPPCPRCGEPQERAGPKGDEAYFFCYRCEAESQPPPPP